VAARTYPTNNKNRASRQGATNLRHSASERCGSAAIFGNCFCGGHADAAKAIRGPSNRHFVPLQRLTGNELSDCAAAPIYE
jgi:hypothetical protein